jgi:hypothetical protein
MLADRRREHGTSVVRAVKIVMGLVGIAPLAVSVLLAGILWVAAFGLAAGFPFAYVLVIAAIWIGSNYAFEVIEHRATGGESWPVLSIETMATVRSQLGSLFAGCVAIVVALYAYLATAGHRELAAALSAVGVIVAPAAIALLAVSRSPRRTLDPRNLAKAAFGLGRYYVAAAFVTIGCVWIADVAYWRRQFPELFASSYAVLGLAFLLGSAAYERRLVLGVYAPRSPEALAEAEYARLLTKRRKALDHAYGIAAGGSTMKALEALGDYVRSEEDSLAARLWLFHEMGRWQNARPAMELGKSLAADLNDAERREEAAKVLVACRYLEERTKPSERR